MRVDIANTISVQGDNIGRVRIEGQNKVFQYGKTVINPLMQKSPNYTSNNLFCS